MGCGDSKDDQVDVIAQEKQTPEYKIIVIGDSSVGKTAIIHQYIKGTFSKAIPPTTGVQNQYKLVEVPGGGVNGKPK